MKKLKLDEQLAALSTMSAAQLRAEWEQVFAVPAPFAFGIDLLARGIAHRLQEQVHGRLSADAERQLREARTLIERGFELPSRTGLRVGTRLARDWGGTTHHVDVVEGGYLYRDCSYTSLSAIAQDITGAKWSGPRFFGLAANARKGERSRVAA